MNDSQSLKKTMRSDWSDQSDSQTPNSLFDQVVDVTYTYLGPAADRFVARQIRNHLEIEPEDLRKRDLRALIDWMKLAMSFLSDDDKLVSEYINSLQELASNRRKETKRAKAKRQADIQEVL